MIVALLPKYVDPTPVRLAAVTKPELLLKFRLFAVAFAFDSAPTVRFVPEIIAVPVALSVRLAAEL